MRLASYQAIMMSIEQGALDPLVQKICAQLSTDGGDSISLESWMLGFQLYKDDVARVWKHLIEQGGK